VLNFKEESSVIKSKTVKSIMKYINLGGCFIALVMVKNITHSFYFLTPSMCPNFDNIDPLQSFRPNPFTNVIFKTGGLNALMKPFLFPITKLREKLLEFINVAQTHTLKFLNEDASMMGSGHAVEQKYMTILENAVGVRNVRYQDFKQGDLFIKGVLVEMKSAWKTSKVSYQSELKPFNANVVDAFGTVLPGMKEMILWPTRTKLGKAAFGTCKRFGFRFDGTAAFTTEIQHAETNSAFVIIFGVTSRIAILETLQNFKNRPLIW
jgi:hypothetical protein